MLDAAQTGSKRSKDESEEARLREVVTCPKLEPERAGTRTGPKSVDTNLMGFFLLFCPVFTGPEDVVYTRKDSWWCSNHLWVLPTAYYSYPVIVLSWTRIKGKKKNQEKGHYKKQCKIMSWQLYVARTVMSTNVPSSHRWLFSTWNML